MSKQRDGGPAFPFFFPERDEEIGTLPCAYQPGMSTRTWLAGLAMQGYIAGPLQGGVTDEYDLDDDPECCRQHFAAVAAFCVGYADALLDELGK
jgi:hypothetical protein